MKSYLRGILVGIGLLVMPSVAAAQETVQIQASVDKSGPIYVGEGFVYQINIEGDNQPGRPDLSPLAQFQPRAAGNKDVSQTVTTIIGSRQETKTTKRLIMNYILTASEPGTFTLPSLSVVHKGKTYRTNPVSITVIEPEATKQMDIEIEVCPVDGYVGEPVEVVVHWYIWASIVQGQLLNDFGFHMPALNNNAFVTEDMNITGSGNRTVNVNGQATPYAAEQVEHDGVASVKVSFAKLLIPQQAGPIEIDPVTISADIAVERVQSRDRFGWNGFFGPQYRYQRFAASTDPVRLNVKPLPAQGKPADFYGLVGRYTISTAAQPTTVNVGDPITLTIRVGGNYL
ncbi:MAG: BatD family protein, partial [Sedimentisphaerales bacterium]|nr:BatD family protein [Sedimentisphaerales bacterium]